ncbi:chromo domain-containing protein [Colletotrichum sp. SAR 10_77]|nr:chromo domain-containing protein [Colletotrichum sp. SAR 10_77]KAJ5001904.1 chromo domain-containing protein [Colletotrichum sp. SAR 10_66]
MRLFQSSSQAARLKNKGEVDIQYKNQRRIEKSKLDQKAIQAHVAGGWEHNISVRDFALYEVRAIISHQVETDGMVYLRVAWRGYPDHEATWEDESTLKEDIPEILRRYYAAGGGRDAVLRMETRK